MRVIYQGASDEQVAWAGGDDPRDCLVVGQEYDLSTAIVRSWHTEYHLVDFPGMWFNSVCFTRAEK